MAKKFFLLIILLPVFLFFGCNDLLEEALCKSISETRENFFLGKKDDFLCTFTDGLREEDYNANGIATKLLPYGVIVLRCMSPEKEIKFELKVNDKVYVGVLEKNPIDLTFVYDIEKRVNRDDSLSIYLVDFDIYINLENLSNSWQINCDKAITIFCTQNKQILTKYYIKNKFLGEIYVKIVGNDENEINYYVLCVMQDNYVVGSLIDVNKGIKK